MKDLEVNPVLEIELRKVAMFAATGVKYVSKKLASDGIINREIAEKICIAVKHASENFNGKVNVYIRVPGEDEIILYVVGGAIIGGAFGLAAGGPLGAAVGATIGAGIGFGMAHVEIRVEISEGFLQLVVD